MPTDEAVNKYYTNLTTVAEEAEDDDEFDEFVAAMVNWIKNDPCDAASEVYNKLFGCRSTLDRTDPDNDPDFGQLECSEFPSLQKVKQPSMVKKVKWEVYKVGENK